MNTDTLWFDVPKSYKAQSIYSRDYSNDAFYGVDYQLENFSFTLVLHKGENNQNHLILVPYGIDSVMLGQTISCAPIQRVKTFQVGTKVFDILELNLAQQYLIFAESDKPSGDIVRYDQHIPSIDFILVNGEKRFFTDYLFQKKYVYVDFWGLWCPQCLKEMPELNDIYLRYAEVLTILSLNNGNSPKEIIEYMDVNGFEWVNGLSSITLERWFFVEGFPHGVLFDSTGKLIKMGCDPAQLELIISESN